jgi:hypothetical protein
MSCAATPPFVAKRARRSRRLAGKAGVRRNGVKAATTLLDRTRSGVWSTVPRLRFRALLHGRRWLTEELTVASPALEVLHRRDWRAASPRRSACLLAFRGERSFAIFVARHAAADAELMRLGALARCW